ncbi:MAG: PriCT-2 domain-containing protein [Bacteroides sp.]|nr:PriCT-2 domain-containing protein [Bacteroides sp.]
MAVLVERIETSHTDIAHTYADWRNLGFALASELGEEGRSYYHRLSHFYAGYKPEEADRQYTACLKSCGHGVTLKTLFYLAQQAGVDISPFPPFLPFPFSGEVPFRLKREMQKNWLNRKMPKMC